MIENPPAETPDPPRWLAAVIEHQRRRAVRREMRAVLEARRRAGLARRHAQRLTNRPPIDHPERRPQ